MKNFKWEEFTKDKDKYGDNYQNHLGELYKFYARTADTNSARRQTSNTFYLTLNTGLVAFCSYRFNPDSDFNFLLILVGILGVGLCYLWHSTLLSHQQLNAKKFEVILKLEKELPFEPYGAEWKLLGEGKDRKVYKEITKIEKRVPFVFGTIYILMVVGLLCFMLWQC